MFMTLLSQEMVGNDPRSAVRTVSMALSTRPSLETQPRDGGQRFQVAGKAAASRRASMGRVVHGSEEGSV